MAYYLIGGLIIIAIAVFLYLENNLIDITKYSYESDCIENSFVVVQLSDMHSKPFKKVLNKLENIKPNVIFITGDYINDKCKNKDKMLDFGKELLKIAPVYYITGNHEKRLANFDDLMQELRDIGFNVLINEEVIANICDNQIAILGLDEDQASKQAYKERRKGIFKYKDMSSYFDNFCKHDCLKLVLSHYPENFEMLKERNYKQYDFDIQFSGHAHGGQFILPFIGPVLSPGQGFFPKYARGTFGSRPRMIVSRGIGNSEFPFRLFNHPEIIMVTFNHNTSNKA